MGTMALHCKTLWLGRRYGRSIVPNRSEPRATAAGKTKQPSSRKTPPLRVGRSHWGQWLYTVRHRRLRVVMVDRLSPIDRNLEQPQPVRQNSRAAERRLRLRVGRSHWGQWLYTVRRRRLRVVMVDRLSPIDRNLEPPQPVRQNSRAAERRRRCASGGAIGDNGSTL